MVTCFQLKYIPACRFLSQSKPISKIQSYNFTPGDQLVWQNAQYAPSARMIWEIMLLPTAAD